MVEQVTCDTMISRWSDPSSRPLFRGKLIDKDGCCCAQGDVLRLGGMTDEELRGLGQTAADKAVARVLGISTAHAVLLRVVNDRQEGCPADVLDTVNGGVQRVLGPHADLVLAFWAYLDTLAREKWDAAEDASRVASRVAAWNAAWNAAGTAAWDASWVASRVAGGDEAGATVGATAEIQGWSKLKTPPYFLPLFGITDATAWVAAVAG